MRLSEALECFVLSMQADSLSSETILWYRKRLSRLVLFLSDKSIDEILLDDLRRFVVSLQSQTELYSVHPFHDARPGKLSPATIQGYVRCVKRIFFGWNKRAIRWATWRVD